MTMDLSLTVAMTTAVNCDNPRELHNVNVMDSVIVQLNLIAHFQAHGRDIEAFKLSNGVDKPDLSLVSTCFGDHMRQCWLVFELALFDMHREVA